MQCVVDFKQYSAVHLLLASKQTLEFSFLLSTASSTSFPLETYLFALSHEHVQKLWNQQHLVCMHARHYSETSCVRNFDFNTTPSIFIFEQDESQEHNRTVPSAHRIVC